MANTGILGFHSFRSVYMAGWLNRFRGRIGSIVGVDSLSRFVFIIGFILCSVVMTFNASTVDYTLTVRHLFWSITTITVFVLLIRTVKDFTVLRNPIFPLFFFYCMATGYSICLSVNSGEVIYTFLRVFMMLVYLFLGTVVLKDQKWFARAVILVTIILGLYGVFESFSVSWSIRRGLMANKNQAASAFFLLMCLCAYYWRRWRVLSTIAILLSLFNIISVRARSTWAALIVASIVGIITYRKYLINKYLILSLLLIFMIFGVFYGLVYEWKVPTSVNDFCILDSTSMRQRLQLWKQTLNMIKDRPMGIGAGNWKIIYHSYSANVSPMMRQMTYDRRFFARVHNDYLQVMAEVGVVGGVMFISVLILGLYYSRGFLRIGFAGFMTIMFFTFPYTRPFHSMMFMIYLALIIIERQPRRPKPLIVKHIFALSMIAGLLLSLTVADFYIRYKTSRLTVKINRAMHKKDWNGVLSLTEKINPLSEIDITSTPLIFYKSMAHFNRSQNNMVKAQNLSNGINYLYSLKEKMPNWMDNFYMTQKGCDDTMALVRKDRKTALEILKECEKISPYHLFVNMNLASLYVVNNDYPSAIKQYYKILKLYPDYGLAKRDYYVALKRYQKWRLRG